MSASDTVIREARPTDAPGIARVHVATWRTTYPGLVPANFLVSMSEDQAARRWSGLLLTREPGHGTFVALDPREGVVGFATCGPRRGRFPDFGGEFYAIYLLDEVQGTGIGRRLMAAMADRLLEGGTKSACVWCLRDNPARWFYERMGGARAAERPIQFAGATLVEIAYGWQDLHPLARMAAGA